MRPAPATSSRPCATCAPSRTKIRRLRTLSEDEVYTAAKNLGAPVELVKRVCDEGRLPVVNFAAGGVATPADAALMMRLGAEGVFVGSGIFKSDNPPAVASAVVQAVTHYQDDELLAQVSRGLGAAMRGLAVASLPEEEVLAKRGW